MLQTRSLEGSSGYFFAFALCDLRTKACILGWTESRILRLGFENVEEEQIAQLENQGNLSDVYKNLN